MNYPYSASAVIREVCEAITNAHPRVAVRANRWDGTDFHAADDAPRPRVRLTIDDEESAIALYVLDGHGAATSSAAFSNMPAAVIAGAVGSCLA